MNHFRYCFYMLLCLLFVHATPLLPRFCHFLRYFFVIFFAVIFFHAHTTLLLLVISPCFAALSFSFSPFIDVIFFHCSITPHQYAYANAFSLLFLSLLSFDILSSLRFRHHLFDLIRCCLSRLFFQFSHAHSLLLRRYFSKRYACYVYTTFFIFSSISSFSLPSSFIIYYFFTFRFVVFIIFSLLCLLCHILFFAICRERRIPITIHIRSLFSPLSILFVTTLVILHFFFDMFSVCDTPYEFIRDILLLHVGFSRLRRREQAQYHSYSLFITFHYCHYFLLRHISHNYFFLFRHYMFWPSMLHAFSFVLYGRYYRPAFFFRHHIQTCYCHTRDEFIMRETRAEHILCCYIVLLSPTFNATVFNICLFSYAVVRKWRSESPHYIVMSGNSAFTIKKPDIHTIISSAYVIFRPSLHYVITLPIHSPPRPSCLVIRRHATGLSKI